MTELLPAPPLPGEMLTQPTFFAPEPADVALCEAARVFLVTGKIVGKDAERAREVCERAIFGHSVRRIARDMCLGRESVKWILREADSAGKLGPLKQRMSRKAGAVIESCLDELQEKADAGTIPANVLPIVVGVLADKKGAWDGEQTTTGAPVAPLVTAESLRAMYEELRTVSVESESTVSPGETVISGQSGGPGAALAGTGGGGDAGGGLASRPSPSVGKSFETKEAS